MHGMIMVIYLLTALFLGGFGNYLIPLMCGARDMVFPYMNMLSFWVYLVSVIVLLASFFVPGGPTGAGWTLYPPRPSARAPRASTGGIVLMLVSLAIFIVAFTMGGLNYVTTVLQARCRGMTLMRMPLAVWGIFVATILGLLAFPALLRRGDHDAARPGDRHQLFHARRCSPWARSWTTAAAARSCSSTCSGSSATRRSTSSRCRPLASSLT